MNERIEELNKIYNNLIKFDNNIIKLNASFFKNALNKKSLENYLKEKINFVNDIKEMLYCYINYLEEIPKCKECGKILKFESFTRPYHNFCSTKCSSNNTEVKNKYKNTTFNKYGSDNYFSSNIGKIKRESILNEKYGTIHPLQNEKIKEKFEKTMIEKYSGKNSFESETLKNKIKNNLKEKHGVDNYMKVKEVKDKLKNSVKKKYGVDNVFQNNDIKEKISKKRKLTFHASEKVRKQVFNKINDLKGLDLEFNYENFYTLKKIDDLTFKCLICDKFFNLSKERKNKTVKQYVKCPYCKQMKYQEEIMNFLNEIVDEKEIKLNDRNALSPKEIDFYIEKFNFGIEFHGLMYHSYGLFPETKKFNNLKFNQQYIHYNKQKLANDKNIILLEIFENEWKNDLKNKIWKSIIKSKLNVYDKVFHGRKGIVKTVSKKDSDLFLENNHLQGKDNSSIRLGLYIENNLVSLMTFGKSRYNKNYEYELYRFCNLTNTKIHGAFSKMLNYFKLNYGPKSLITYCDLRHSNGNIYNLNGFTFLKTSKPNYFWYYNNNINQLYSRIQFQKHKLKEYYENNLNNIIIFDENKTEKEIMFENKYRIIYDSGNYVFYINF